MLTASTLGGMGMRQYPKKKRKDPIYKTSGNLAAKASGASLGGKR